MSVKTQVKSLLEQKARRDSHPNRKGRRRKRRSAKRKEENAARKQMIEDLGSISDA